MKRNSAARYQRGEINSVSRRLDDTMAYTISLKVSGSPALKKIRGGENEWGQREVHAQRKILDVDGGAHSAAALCSWRLTLISSSHQQRYRASHRRRERYDRMQKRRSPLPIRSSGGSATSSSLMQGLSIPTYAARLMLLVSTRWDGPFITHLWKSRLPSSSRLSVGSMV